MGGFLPPSDTTGYQIKSVRNGLPLFELLSKHYRLLPFLLLFRIWWEDPFTEDTAYVHHRILGNQAVAGMEPPSL